MAQIIKHRRGSVSALKDVTANIGELVMATGSIGDFNGPIVFVGDAAVAGGYKPVSKIYQGSSAPTISVGSHGSTMDGIPFYSTNDKTLYILDKSGNSDIDLTGNIEGNTISGVTITSLTGSHANVTNITGTTISGSNVRVSSNLNVTGDISGSNMYLTGNAIVDGNITLGGNITIGDQTTDIIQFGGEVSSSILPKVHNAFDLGSSELNWRNLHVSGTAYIDILEAQQVNFNDLGILTDLTVSGSTYLGNGGDITVVSGSLYNDQLTEKRLVVVGTDGLITDYSGLTFDNGNLNLSGALEVTNIQGTGSLYLKPDLNDSRDFRIYNTSPSDIHIKGNAAYSFFGDDTNYLKIDDNTSSITINSVTGVSINTTNTTVTGSLYNDQLTDNRIVIVGVDGLLEDDSNFTFDGTTLQVGAGWFGVDTDGDIRTSGSLLVTSTTQLKDSVGINSTLDVTGSVTLKDSLSVSGATTIDGLTTINNDLIVNGILTVTGDTQLHSNLYVSGNLEVLGSATNVNLQSSTVEIGDNIILVNAYSPFQRYAGLAAYDSGSSGVSGSLLWDSLNDYWMFVSGSGQTSKMIGTTAGPSGYETSLTSGTFPIADGSNTISDSLLTYSGTTLAFNTNKFTIDSGTGDTEISGNVTLSYSGGTDSGTLGSTVVFRNASNVLGYVSSTDTQNVTTQLLGYNSSTGILEFSSVVDGGTY